MIKVRFAPSPYGNLHISNAMNALYNYLFARRLGGRFIVRFDDTDTSKVLPSADKHILDDLAWLGMDWDDVQYQSVRQANGIYKPFIERLLSSNLAYHCYCSQEELALSRLMMREKHMPIKYNGKCRGLSPQERQRLEENGTPYIIRFAVQDGEPISFSDAIKKRKFAFKCTDIGDFVIAQVDSERNITPMYLFAGAVDDQLMEITNVIRDEKHIPDTPKQILIHKALGFEKSPSYAHLPVLLLTLGNKQVDLTNGGIFTTIHNLRRRGFIREGILNYIFHAGYQFGKYTRNISVTMSVDDMKENFNINGISRSRRILNNDEMISINNKNIIKLSPVEVEKRVKEYISINEDKLDLVSQIDLLKVIKVYQPFLRTLSFLDSLYQKALVYDDKIIHLLSNKPAISLLLSVRKLLIDTYDLSKLSLSDIRKLNKDITKQEIQNILRATIIGSEIGPDSIKIIKLLGLKNTIKKINFALKILIGHEISAK